MATHLVWIKPDGTVYQGTLENKPFIQKHFPLPESNKGRIIPFTEMRQQSSHATDITSITMLSRVTEELESLEQVAVASQFLASEGTLVFVGAQESTEGQCSIQ